MGRKSLKESILDAAERVIRRQGMASTTVEGVAAEAGVSKGGLFYHFSSKKEMLFQLLERYEKKFFATRQEVYDSLPDDPNRLLKATIIASINHPAKSHTDMSNVLSLLDDIEMREKVSEMKVRVFKEISAGYEKPEKIALAMMAADGMWVMDLFGGGILSPGFQEKIIAELLRLIDSESKACSSNDEVPALVGEDR